MSTLSIPVPNIKPRTAAGRLRPERFARLAGDFLRDFAGVLTLTVGDKATEYSLERLDLEPDFGAEAYRFTKHVGHPADECDVYHVTMSDGGHSCECLGHLRHADRGTVCKHVAALVALRTAGRI